MSILLSSAPPLLLSSSYSQSLPPSPPPPLPSIKHLAAPIATTSSFLKSRSLVPLNCRLVLRRSREKMGAVCYAPAVPISPQNLQWVSAVSSAVLMLVKGTTIQKSFLVPLFALQAPSGVISWIKGENGTWIAFVALLVRLFFFIPGQLDLPFLTMLLVIVAPYRTMDLRGSQAGAVISFAIAGYLAFQHFSRARTLRRAFDEGSIVATLAVICITAVSCLFLFRYSC